MSWIKWTHGLSRKPEVMQIAYRLSRSRHEVAGLLMEWWEWTDVNVNIDESASGYDPDACPGVVRVGEDGLRMIDAITGVTGMAESLVSVGWASIENGNLVLPNFGRHNGKSAKARALDAARKRADRRNSVRKTSGSKPDKIRNRGEERREEKSNTPLPPVGGSVEKPARARKLKDEHPHFAAFWSAYPLKVAKAKASAAFAKINPDDGMLARMLAALDWQKKSAKWTKDNGEYIPHPATWLNAARWDDQPDVKLAPPPPPAPPPLPEWSDEDFPMSKTAQRVLAAKAAERERLERERQESEQREHTNPEDDHAADF